MSYALFADIASIVLIFAGALLVLSASIGVARFLDPMARIHFVTKPQTVGLVFTILGAAIRVTVSESVGIAERGDLGILFLLVVFALATSPVTDQRMTRISRREGLYADDDQMSRNDQPATKQMLRK